MVHARPRQHDLCDSTKISIDARAAAAAAGADLSAYGRYIYIFPQNSGCWWSGMETVGGNPSRAWINGSIAPGTISHEVGHNFGLDHSHALGCGSTTLGSSCSPIEYGDVLDTMGSSHGHFNAFQKEQLGWLDNSSSPPITTVEANGTYMLNPTSSMAPMPTP